MFIAAPLAEPVWIWVQRPFAHLANAVPNFNGSHSPSRSVKLEYLDTRNTHIIVHSSGEMSCWNLNIYFAVPQFCGRITAITFAQSNFIVAFAVAAAAAVLTIMGARSRLLFLYNSLCWRRRCRRCRCLRLRRNCHCCGFSCKMRMFYF